MWRVSTSGGEETQASEGTAYSPAFSPDGNFVAYFRSADRINIVVMAVETGKILKTFTFADGRSIPVKIAWAIDNKTFNYIAANGPKNSLWRQSLDNDKPELIADLGNEDIGDFALSPDGSSFAFTRGKWIHNAVLIEGLK